MYNSYNYLYGPTYGDLSSTFMIVCNITTLIICILFIAASWKVLTKAGQPGWACLIPFYSQYKMFEIVYGSGWKFLLLLIPLYNIYLAIKYNIDLAHAYGQSTGFGIGLIFLQAIFIPILGFGKSEYIGTQKF